MPGSLASGKTAQKIDTLFGHIRTWARSNHVLQQAISEGRLVIQRSGKNVEGSAGDAAGPSNEGVIA